MAARGRSAPRSRQGGSTGAPGTWLSTAELDGRNGTDEIVGSGYGGRILLLYRPPGYARDDGPPTDPDPSGAEDEGEGDGGEV